MNWLVGVGLSVALAVSILYFTDIWRYAKTIYLIQQVEPYEQAGSGAGSILVIGDSTGYGTGASLSADSVAGRMGQDFPAYQIINNSVNGRKIAGAQEVADKLDTEYHLIVLQIGANDLLAERPVSEVVADMQTLVDTVTDHAPQVVILTAGNIAGVPIFSGREAEYYETVSREYDSLMRLEYDSVENVTFISLFDEPADDPFVAEPHVYTALDGLHPSTAGYGVWYEKAAPTLKRRLTVDD